MSRRESILDSKSDRFECRSNRTPSRVNKKAYTSRQPEHQNLQDYYTPRFESAFPHQEDYGRLNIHKGFGF